MKVWIISDTHCQHEKMEIPRVDMVIHCGDESNHLHPPINANEANEFFKWYNKLYPKYKLFVPGNHSTAVYTGHVHPDQYPGIEFLIDRSIEINGFKFYGSPWVPVYGPWAFMRKRNTLEQIWKNIPDDTDILITHGPPKGILDTCINPDKSLEIAGCKALLNRVSEIQPLVHCFGHFHDNGDVLKNFGLYRHNPEGTIFINAAALNHRNDNINQGIILDLNKL